MQLCIAFRAVRQGRAILMFPFVRAISARWTNAVGNAAGQGLRPQSSQPDIVLLARQLLAPCSHNVWPGHGWTGRSQLTRRHMA
ncbi:hypothetical protein V8C86DRAFT_1807711 [Haematococcus lacustris]